MDRHLKTLSLFVILFFSSAIIVHSQEHSLVKIWSSDTVLKVPESVLYDAKTKYCMHRILMVKTPGLQTEKDQLVK